MSFLSGLKDLGGKALGFLQSDTLGGNLAKTALLGFATYKMNQSVNKANDANKEQPSRIQASVDSTNSIPVVYGDAYVKGIIVDAHQPVGDKGLMYFVVAISEKTGNLIDGTASAFSFREAYFNGLRVDFDADGFSISQLIDEEGTTKAMDGLIKVYPFNGNSTSATTFTSEATGNTSNAYDIMPNWDSNDMMNDLNFVVVSVRYNAEKDIRNLGEWTFKVRNTMKQPGDVMFDYMTNTRYGAGIPEAEINKQ